MLIENLEKEKEILNRDNITLEIEINNLEDVVEKLNLEYENGNILKNEINAIIESAKEQKDKIKENFYIKDVLEPLEKKLYDIKQMAVIKEQSSLALGIIRRNNKEIIRNLERIKNVTIVALNTAVMVAKSLYNQNLVLKKIQTLEKGTGNLIQGTGIILKEQGEKIYNVAVNDKPEEALKFAFNNVFETLSQVDEKNKNAFPENQIQVLELRKMEDSNG